MIGALVRRGWSRLRFRATEIWRDLSVWLRTRHVHGPARIEVGPADCTLICMLRNAEYFIEELIRHHQALGVAHVVIIDNGSTDRTIEMAKAFANVTIMSNTLPVGVYECKLRALIARRVVRGGWFLFVDADELFDFPGRGAGGVAALAGYCNRHGYSAVVCQMLDLFAPERYGRTKGWTYPASIAAGRHYSLNEIDSFDYFDRENIGFNYFLRRNSRDFTPVRFLFGGLRHEVFGEDCCLTKHSLVRNSDEIALYAHPHCSGNVRVADVTGVLRHYKLCGPYLENDARTVAEGTWSHGEDKRRVERAGAGDDFTVSCARPELFEGPDALVTRGFLVSSERYRAEMIA